MGVIYKNYLKQVNLYINNNFFINPFIEYQIKEYIINDRRLKELEKKYLINKIDGFRVEYLKGLGNGNFNIFKLPKRIICFENIYFLMCHIKNSNLNTKEVIRRIEANLDNTFIKEEQKNELKKMLYSNAG